MMNNILIVDDNSYFLEGLMMSLRHYLANCKILTAASGELAMEILESMPIDLIVSDLYMPSMDGYNLAERAKKKHPDTPVFIMTGGAIGEIRKRLLSLGVSRCIEKPFGFKDLADLIRAELEGLDPSGQTTANAYRSAYAVG